MQMRKSRVLELLRAGKPVFSIKLNTTDPRISELAALSGFTCIWVDMEHTPNDYSVVERHIVSAKAHDADVLVRVARGSYSDYIRPLELDAAGIMAPHVLSVKDAESIVKMTRFFPLGRRPADGGNADGLYALLPAAEYHAQANSQRFIILQIEDQEALDAVDEIAAVPGYDILFFGPGDYSHALGVPGQIDHPLVKEAARKVALAAARHGKFAGTVGSVDTMDALLDTGYNFINLGADVVGLAGYFGGIIRRIGSY